MPKFYIHNCIHNDKFQFLNLTLYKSTSLNNLDLLQFLFFSNFRLCSTDYFKNTHKSTISSFYYKQTYKFRLVKQSDLKSLLQNCAFQMCFYMYSRSIPSNFMFDMQPSQSLQNK